MAENRTTSKKDLEEVVIRVDECMNGAGGIKDQLKDMDQKNRCYECNCCYYTC